MQAITTEEQLEEILSRPSEADVAAARQLEGGVCILGAGGKMGPSLARRARRALDRAGKSSRVLAVSRFSSDAPRILLERDGIETAVCDLLDPNDLARLPFFANVFFLAGRKFGSTERADLTWATNTLVPVHVAQQFPGSRIVAFSTGNVYPFVSPDSGGSVETDPPDPRGEYAQSCLCRERLFEYYSRERNTRCLIFRLNYAVDLRYGTLVDIATRVQSDQPIDLSVGWMNAIWQGDANSYALRCLPLCETPAQVLNVTGPEIISVRQVAEFFAGRFGRKARLEGSEGTRALLSNASRCHTRLGPPEVGLQQLLEWVAAWVEAGGRLLGKPTRYEVTDGKF